MSEVSIVIITGRKRDGLLRRVLFAIARGRLQPAEVILVETARMGGREQLCDGLELNLSWIEQASGSFAEARNAGVKAAAGEWIAFLDDDCEPASRWLEQLTIALATNDWLAAGGSVFPATEFETPDAYSPELAWATGCTPPGCFGPLAGQLYAPSTSSLIATRELFLQHPFQSVSAPAPDGALSEEWSYDTGREDAEWWRSIRRGGVACGFTARAIVWHHISSERFEHQELKERVRADGRAHWQRTKSSADIRPAARDVVQAPVNALREIFSEGYPPSQVVGKHFAWAARQVAFMNAAASDLDHGIPPMDRASAYALAVVHTIAGLLKSAIRHVARMGFDAFKINDAIPNTDHPPRRLIVVLHDFLGDAVLAIPTLTQLAQAFPRTKITVLSGPVATPLLRANLARNCRVVEVPTQASRGPLASIHLYRLIKPLNPDAVLVAYAHNIPALPFFLLHRVPVIGWREDNGFRRQLWSDLLEAPVQKNFRKHESAALLDLLAPFGIEACAEQPRIHPSADAVQRVDSLLAHAGHRDRFVVVHFEAGDRPKIWPAERLAEVVKNLVESGLPVFLVGSRAGRIEAERQGILALERCHSLHHILNSDELAALVSRSMLFLGCDSGPAHVAYATGAPAVVLFGATEAHRWGPSFFKSGDGSNVTILSAAPGDWLEEESRGLPANEAMRHLSVDAVLAAVKKVIAQQESASGVSTVP